MFKLRTLIYSLFMMFIVAGCCASGSTNFYQQGKNDGCWSKQHPGTKKNIYLYNHNSNYRNGWKYGYSHCH
ncbi:MAG: hypothetical protein P8Y50_03880 [Sulfurovaceae bacterium]